jgi:glycosyltransferase involved in cell wall biosynthesis
VRPLAGTLPRSFERGYSLLLKQADAVVVHSQAERVAAVQLGAIPERLHVIAPAPPFLPIESVPTREQARIKLGLRPDDPVVLFFGFIKPYKGLAVLLRSLPGALGRRRDLRLIVAGRMMEPRRRYDTIVDELHIAHAVHWIRGYVPSADVATVFAAADVVALPYLDASSSGVLLTAYALGRPVIATAVGGLPELVEAGRTGLLVPPDDARALSEAIAALLADPDRAREMGTCGLDLLERRFTWGAMARHVGEIYRQLVAAPRRGASARD